MIVSPSGSVSFAATLNATIESSHVGYVVSLFATGHRLVGNGPSLTQQKSKEPIFAGVTSLQYVPPLYCPTVGFVGIFTAEHP